MKDKDLQHLAAIVRDSTDAILGKTLEGIITSWNRGAERIYGYTAEEAIGRTVAMLIPPDREDELPKILQKLTQGEGINHYDTLRVTKDGRLLNISVTISPIRDAYGTITGASSIGRDVTSEKEAEAALRESARAYKLLMEQASDAILVSYPDQPLIEVNQRASDMLGYTREELLELRSQGSALPEGLSTLPFRLDEILEGDIVYTERPVRRKDGTTIVTELSTRRLDDGRIVTIARDITERKQIEQVRKESEQRLQGVIDGTLAIIYVKDLEGRYLLVNRAFESMVGLSKEQIAGKNDYELFSKETADIFRTNDSIVMETRESLEFEDLVFQEDGMHSCTTNKFLLYDHTGEPYALCGISNDVTEHKRAEEALHESEERHSAILEQVSESIFLIDPDTMGFVSVNPAFCKLVGYTASELLGMQIYDVLPYERERIDRAFQRALTEGAYNVSDRLYRRKDGSLVPVEIGITPVLYAGRTLLCEIVRDITERQRAEEEVAFERYLLNSLMENTPDSIYFKDREGKFTRINRALAESVGLDPAEAVGKSDFDLFSEELARSAHIDEQEIISTGRPILSKEELEVWEDGRETWVLTTKMPLRDAHGNITGTFGVSRQITEQKKVEESLRESEARFRLMFASNPLPMWVYDVESLRFLEVNEAAVVRYGYSRDEFLSMLITDIRPAEELPRLMENLAQERPAFQFSGEWQHQTKAGQIIDTQVTSHTFAFGEQEQEQSKGTILVVAEDITERKRADEALRASEEKFRAIFENTLDAVFITDDEGRFVDVNHAASSLVGLPAEELVGRSYADFHNLQSTIGLGQLQDQVSERGEARGDLQIVGANGEVSDVEYFSIANFIPGYNLAVAHDLTERRHAELALRESEVRYRSLVETSPDSITLTDLQGTILVCNPQSAILHGYSGIEDMLGRNALDMLAPEDHQRATADMSRVISLGAATNLEYTSLRKDGSRFPSEINGSVTLDSEGKPSGFMTIMRDITGRREVEQERWAREAAEQANRAKSEFLSRMSHELRTPLNAILGFGQLLQMDTTTPEQEESVGYILKAGHHLLNLINEVLDIARIEEGKLTISIEPVLVHDVLQESLDLVQPLAARRNITVTADLMWMGNLHVMADRRMLQQVMLNLLANAIKYNREGGEVTVSCCELNDEAGEGQQHQEPQSLLPEALDASVVEWKANSRRPLNGKQTLAPQPRVRITVSDTGPGLSPDKVARLFTPFERLGAEQSEVEGTGLGLALSKHLVEAMGGAIGAESVPGVGSTFWVELSPTDEQMPGIELIVTGPLFETQLGEQVRLILYIEDNLSNLRLLERILKQWPWITLITAMQGQMGLDMAYEHQPDLILLDLHLPDMPGNEVLRRLQDVPRTSSIPVVVLSADANPRGVDKLLKAGARAYLTKPFDVKQLLKVLAETHAKIQS